MPFGCRVRRTCVPAARTVARSVALPVVADAESGFGDIDNLRRTVREFEDAGIAGLHLEDQRPGVLKAVHVYIDGKGDAAAATGYARGDFTPVEVSELLSGSPADHAGLRKGDELVSIDALQVHSVPALLAYMQDQKGQPAILRVLRDGRILSVGVTPQLTDVDNLKAYRLGFQPVSPPVKVEQLSFSKSVAKSWEFTKQNSTLIKDVVKGMLQGHVSVKQLSGPVGIARMAGQAAEMEGWFPKFGLAAAISLNLGILNLLPFPILDGGMILFLLIESVLRHDINMLVKERIYQAAFVLILVFFAFVIFNDVTKLPIFSHLKP